MTRSMSALAAAGERERPESEHRGDRRSDARASGGLRAAATQMKNSGGWHFLYGQFVIACRTPQTSFARSGRSFLSSRQHLSASLANSSVYSGGHSPAEVSIISCNISLLKAASTSFGRPRGIFPVSNRSRTTPKE